LKVHRSAAQLMKPDVVHHQGAKLLEAAKC